MNGRRRFLGGCLQLAAATIFSSRVARCGEAHDLVERIDGALGAAVRFLANRQAADGAWRSEVYGPFKDGPSLTSLIAATLAPIDEPIDRRVCEKAVSYLAKLVSPEGTIIAGPEGITYPVYTAAGAAIAITRQPGRVNVASRDAWLADLRQRQLTEERGWNDSDLAYGGWSYAQEAPRPADGKPATPLAVPNLSATAFALEALRTAGCPASDPAIRKALFFVQRCQNWGDEAAKQDSEFDDGGFFFIVEDPQRNKAGEAGTDSAGRIRFVSYGSATADGLRALRACGLASDHPQVIAARQWLESHFSAEQHPGRYAPAREHLKPAVYFYYAASVSQALDSGKEPSDWAETLSQSLLQRQRMDGSWINSVVEVREDDPLVATPLGIRALLNCRATIVSLRAFQ